MPKYERQPENKETPQTGTHLTGQDNSGFHFFMAWLLLFLIFGCVLAASLLASI